MVVVTVIRADRIAEVVVINGRLYESIAPVRRAALRAAPESLTLQEQPTRHTWVRTEAERVFATELAGAGRDAEAVVEQCLSFEVWDQLRSSQGLSPTCAAATVTFALTALLKQSP